MEKLILDPNPDQSQNLIKCSLFEGLPSQKFDEHLFATFWVILFNVYNALSLYVRKVEKMLLDSDPDLDQSQILIEWSLAEGLSFQNVFIRQ